jgi:glycosyltransferase involved in cell wall biosynthesis
VNISVLIPARNEAGSIGKLLTQVCEDDHAPNTLSQVLVYDDDSSDNTAAIVAERAKGLPKVRLIQGARRLGATVAFNALLRASTGDIVIKVDGDLVLNAGCLRRLAGAIANGADVAFGFGDPVCLRPTLVARAGIFAGRLGQELGRGRFGADYNRGEIMALSGALARRTAVPDDLTNKEHYCVLAARRSGGTIALVPEARWRYLVSTTFADYWRQSRRVLAAERQLRARCGNVQGSMLELLRVVWRCALRAPFAALCWAAAYCTSCILPNPAGSSAFPESPSTKWPK